MLNKVLNKIKMLKGIERFNSTKILIDTDNKLADEVTLENVVILISRIIKDDDKFYLQLFLLKNH